MPTSSQLPDGEDFVGIDLAVEYLRKFKFGTPEYVAVDELIELLKTEQVFADAARGRFERRMRQSRFSSSRNVE